MPPDRPEPPASLRQQGQCGPCAIGSSLLEHHDDLLLCGGNLFDSAFACNQPADLVEVLVIDSNYASSSRCASEKDTAVIPEGNPVK